MVASRLWHYLGDRTPSYHQACVELLYQLHQITPNAWTCENVIGNSLLSEDKVVFGICKVLHSIVLIVYIDMVISDKFSPC